MSDDLERRLRDAVRPTDFPPAPPGLRLRLVEIEQRPIESRRHAARKSLLILVPVAAVLVLGVSALIGGGQRSSVTVPTLGASASPLAASPPPTAPESPLPADLPICKTSQLAITTTNSGAAGGMVAVYLRFINRGNQACSLHGWPTVIGVTASGATTTARNDLVGYLPFPDIPIQTVSLKPGDDAFAALSGGDNSGSAAACPPSYHTFRVTPPGNTQAVVLSAFNIGLNHDFTACVGLVASPIVSAAQMNGFIVYPLRP
jgi:hypothetical protein